MNVLVFKSCPRPLLFVLLILWTSATVSVCGQGNESYDVFSFATPAGWTRSVADGSLTFLKADASAGGYALATLFSSRSSMGTVAKDFEREWEERVRARLDVPGQPTTERPQVVGRWNVQAGIAPFTFEGRQNIAMLTVFSGEGLAASVLVVINSEAILGEAKRFVDSISLSAKTRAQGTKTETIETPQSLIAAPGTSPQVNRTGISKSKTNFSDGWVATIQGDHILLTKKDIHVMLFFPEPITEQMRPPTIEVRDHFWRTLVVPRFNVTRATALREAFSQMEFVEGEAMEKGSDKRVFLAMTVLKHNAVARTVVAVAPSKQAYSNAFPHPDDLGALVNANRFAVTQEDLLGEWSGGGAATANLYYVDSGRFAGMTTTAISDKFIFSPNGSYQSMHKGAGGQVGTMQFFSEKYSGRMSVTDWEITLTNRANGKTSVFLAYFEAINGGRVLHLTDKQYSGTQYYLVKFK